MKTSPSDPSFPLRFISTRSSAEIRTGFQRFERPVYDYASKYSPCRAACPAAHDIALALYMASLGRFDLAWKLFREESPFPGITGRVCYHPCEVACNRGGYDEPVAINALERALDEYGSKLDAKAPARRYPESVGIVGAGPAGLTCAYHLARLGYGITVYDANPSPGGMLAYAIPAYRLPADIVARAADDIASMGVEFRCGVRVGEDISMDELRRRHNALLLAPGLSASRTPKGMAADDARVVPGLEFLRRMRMHEKQQLQGSVAVIGGGDVAVDAARSAMRCGADRVSIYCPEARALMPAHPQELSSAAAEGVLIMDCLLPEALQAENGLHLVMRDVEEVLQDDSGAYSFRTGERTTLHGPFDYVIYAVGQQAELSWVPEPLLDGGRISCGPFGETAEPGIFAGGDAAGTYNVVNAIASGKRAAIGIDSYLRGLSLHCVAERISVGPDGPPSMAAYIDLREGLEITTAVQPIKLEHINLSYFPKAKRAQQPTREDVCGFQEVNLPLSRSAAEEEAARCFNCGLCNMCGNCFHFCPDSAVLRRRGWGFEIDLDHCKGCGICVEECPRGAMRMVPEAEAQDDAK
ncbi:MAG: FAD-dependent oxidoreductase [Armatimonadota bacterium]